MATRRAAPWYRRVAAPRRWSPLAREIALVLVIKKLLLIVVVKAVAPAPAPRPAVAGGIERQLLGGVALPATPKDVDAR